MTDTPAEAPRTPDANPFWFLDDPTITRAVYALCDALGLRDHFKHAENHAAMARAFTDYARAALAARDAEVLAKLEGWRRDHRYEGPFNPEDIYEELRALLSEGKPGK